MVSALKYEDYPDLTDSGCTVNSLADSGKTLGSEIANGTNGDGRKATGRLINAIRNYEREDTGWLAYKERLSAGGGGTPSQTHEEERHRDRYEKQLEGL